MRSLVIVLVMLAALLAPIGGLVVADAVLATADTPTVSVLSGDDNGDGTIDEDESGWDCSTMGNGICGPVLPDVTTLADGSMRVECPAYGELFSRDGSDSLRSLACRPV